MDDWRALVPVLTDRTITLRAPMPSDYPAIATWAADPDSIRWTTIPTPDGGYRIDDARSFIDEVVSAGWVSGHTQSWIFEAEVDGVTQPCGQIDLRSDLDLNRLGAPSGADRPVPGSSGSVGFVAHPRVRGRGLTTRALRLVVEHGFAIGLSVIRWQAAVGNDASWRVAAAVGFTFEGVRRQAECLRDTWVDMWQASILSDDPRTPNPHPVNLARPQEPPPPAG